MFYSILISIHVILCLFILLICLKVIVHGFHSLRSRCRLLIVSLRGSVQELGVFGWVRVVVGWAFGGSAVWGLRWVFGVGLRLKLKLRV